MAVRSREQAHRIFIRRTLPAFLSRKIHCARSTKKSWNFVQIAKNVFWGLKNKNNFVIMYLQGKGTSKKQKQKNFCKSKKSA